MRSLDQVFERVAGEFYTAKGRISDIEIYSVPFAREVEILLHRRIHNLDRMIDFAEQRPAWEAFVHARQGSE